MIVSFWSPFKGHSKTSSSLLSVACSLALDYDIQIMMVDSLGTSVIEEAFAKLREIDVDQSLNGINAVASLIRTGKLNGTTLKDSCSYVVDKKLYYLNTVREPEEGLCATLHKALDCGKTEFDIQFVDLGSGTLSAARQQLKDKSDLLIICLPQNLKMLKTHKKQIKDFIGTDKHIVCVGDFEEESSISLRKVAKEVGVLSKDCFGIPHNVGLMDSIGSSNVIRFFEKLRGQKATLFKMTEDEICVRNMRSVGKRILTLTGRTVEKVGVES